ncbi:MAG: phospholipid carrier-dependent glycosyltransferase [Actinobacteria bacterium]|nr:phospholipid carrier-dependent glycosyltransferase [Actinomycetota bacterium]
MADEAGPVARGHAATVGRGLRRHWLIAALLVLAAALRAVVLAAYRPALIFPDSDRYLRYAARFAAGHWSPDTIRPSGYSIMIIPAAGLHSLILVPVVQHLLGLAAGAAIYALLVHFGSRRWLAALAAVPVLFDPLELDLEQYVLSDVAAALLVFAGLAVLVWRGSRLGRVAAAGAGLLLGAAVVTRVADLALIVPALLYLALAVRPGRRLASRAALVAGCFLLPVLGYAGWYASAHGSFGLTGYNGTFLYGRVVDFADCQGLSLPADERPLCPREPPGQRNYDAYMWSVYSPAWTFKPPAGQTRQSVLLNFSTRVLEHQPQDYFKAVGADLAYGFSPVRGNGPERYPVTYLKFQTQLMPYAEVQPDVRQYGHTSPAVQPQLARFLSGYGRYCYVPGPVLAFCLLIALAGLTPMARRSRGRGLRTANLAFTGSAVTALVAAAAFAPFDWRYQLPQLTLIPVAAGLAVTALTARRSPSPDPAVQPGQAAPALRRR